MSIILSHRSGVAFIALLVAIFLISPLEYSYAFPGRQNNATATQTANPSEPVAMVGSQIISIHDFQRRVTFERWRSGTLLQSIYNSYGADWFKQLVGQTGSPYATAYQQMASPRQMGKAALDELINALLIKQYADANNIQVSEADVQAQINTAFGYDPNPPTATPTPQGAATATPWPTNLPAYTPTPGPTEQKQQFDKNTADYYANALKATGFTEADIRQIYVEQALQAKVKTVLFGNIPHEQEEIHVAHILVDSEAKAQAAIKKLHNGASFDDLARSISLDTSAGQGGDLGWSMRRLYVPEFDSAIWDKSAKDSDILGPIKTQFGYHIIQILGHRTRRLTDDEYQQLQNKKFSDWLTQQGIYNSLIFDVWANVVPEKPALADFGIPDNLTGSPAKN